MIRGSKEAGGVAGWLSGGRGLAAALILYPIVTALARPLVFFVPFDSETAVRFIEEFLFRGNANVSWALGESLRWGLVRPVYSITFLSDFMLFGTDYRFYHLTDFLLSWATFGVIAQVLLKSWSRWAAWLTIVFWMLLPAQGWSLASMTGRNDRLAALFLLLALREADGWVARRPGQGRQILLVLLLLAGFLSKESAAAGFALPFAWLSISGGWSVREVLGRTKTAWISAIVVPVAGFGIRTLMSLPLGDVGTLHTGTAYLAQFGRFVAEGTGMSFFIDPVLIGAASIAALASVSLIRKLPREVRFGAFLCLCTIAPFAFVWIQHSFHWMPSLGYSMILAGILSWEDWIPSRIRAVLATVVVLAFAFWGSVETSRICAPGIAYRCAVRDIVARGEALVDGSVILTGYPALAGPLGYSQESVSQMARDKARGYIENLVQISMADSSATILWPGRSD